MNRRMTKHPNSSIVSDSILWASASQSWMCIQIICWGILIWYGLGCNLRFCIFNTQVMPVLLVRGLYFNKGTLKRYTCDLSTYYSLRTLYCINKLWSLKRNHSGWLWALTLLAVGQPLGIRHWLRRCRGCHFVHENFSSSLGVTGNTAMVSWVFSRVTVLCIV